MERNKCSRDKKHLCTSDLDLKDENIAIELEKQDKIKYASLLMNLHKQKIHGIMPGELFNSDVDNCYTETNDVGKQSKLLRKKPFVEQIIISDENRLYKLWVVFNMIMCVVSSYFYAYMAAFKAPKPGDDLHHIMIFFECMFAVDIILKFLKSFTKDGETMPTIDLAKIAQRYLKGQFALDFIPLIPLFSIFTFKGHGHLYIVKCIRIINGFSLFNVSEMMADIRTFFSKRLE